MIFKLDATKGIYLEEEKEGEVILPADLISRR